MKRLGRGRVLRCTNCSLRIAKGTRVTKKAFAPSSVTSYPKKFDEIALVIRNIIRDGSVLEVGMGRGFLTSLTSPYNSRLQKLLTTASLKFATLGITKNKVTSSKKSYDTYIKNTSKKFNLIVFLHTLDQFSNPRATLKKAKNLLKKEGLVLILLPNAASFVRVLAKEKKSMPPRPYEFTPKSIQQLLINTGYDAQYQTTFEESSEFKAMLNIRIKPSQSVLRRGGIILYYFLRKVFWVVGLGGTLCVVARKKS